MATMQADTFNRRRLEADTQKHPQVMRCQHCAEYTTLDPNGFPQACACGSNCIVVSHADVITLELTPWDRRFLRSIHLAAN